MSNIKMIFHNFMELKYHDDYSEDVNEILMSYRHMKEVDLINALATIGLETRRIELQLKNIEVDALPCLLISNIDIENFCSKNDHLILTHDKREEQFYLINDHDLKRQIEVDRFPIKYALFIREFNEVEFRNEKILRNTSMKFSSWTRAIKRRFNKAFSKLIILSLINTLNTLAFAIYALITYKVITGDRPSELLIPATTGIILLQVISYFARGIRSNIINWCTNRIDYILETAILEKSSTMSDHQREIEEVDFHVNRFEDIKDAVNFLTSENNLKLIDTIFNTLLIFPIFFLSWEMAIPLAFLAPMVTFLYYSNLKKIRIKKETYDQLHENKNNLVNELKRGSEEIYLENLFPIFSKRLSSLSSMSYFKEQQYKMNAYRTEFFSKVITVTIVLASTIIGLLLVWNQELAIANFIAVLVLMWSILTTAQQLPNSIQKLDSISFSFRKLHKLFCKDSEERTYRSSKELYTRDFEIDFKSVSFQYPDTLEIVFSSININIKPNQVYGIHGSANSGKRAFIKLLNKTYLPQSGSILIGGIDHRQFDTLYLRQQILTLNLKKSLLKDMSIYENIKCINPLITRDDIMIHLGFFGIGELLEDSGLTIDTPLSGATRLKISNELYSSIVLAIPFCTQAKVVLIEDIPTSIINKQFKLLKKFLNLSKKNFTVVFCSEHKEILKEADNIIYMAPNKEFSSGTKDKIFKYLEENALI
ncbi:ABC transporter, ATP-binding domain protein [Bacteriovorax sp. BAL6_X]|uniref:ATP-binding cassette domain-containing protein n=1 Tax=Bacteriovorax sp. BAL6_X TaxID=1201290 RepID=UPI000386B07F|nr:ATP-binding cassette domain-containing protein [Bacteriovorax sp. BAL6_X]EPZ51243.1 ABC transporter, ATP-binding domain protein [Bacteriovorax sp. BAL6_X]